MFKITVRGRAHRFATIEDAQRAASAIFARTALARVEARP